MKRPLDHARALLEKARHDLAIGTLGLADEEVADMVCFHAQQGVEKSLKALIAAQGADYPLTHDLEVLLKIAGAFWSPSEEMARAIIDLSGYAVAVRYDEDEIPSEQEAQAALSTAEQVSALVAKLVEELDSAVA